MYNKITAELRNYINPAKAVFLPRFFKTGPGEYGEGDKFIGIVVPDQRSVAKTFYKDTKLSDVQELLNNKIHEYRLTGLIILTYQYADLDKLVDKKKIVNFYLQNTKNINNWDLVDLSAHKILGTWLLDKDKKLLYKLANSKVLWEKRISMMSTYTFIKNKNYKDTLAIAKILLNDTHDLIHKVVGWMLREVARTPYTRHIV